jgi:filamentous hemagglutinin
VKQECSAWPARRSSIVPAIETHLAKTEYSVDKGWYNVGAERNGYFPLVDFQNGNTLVSLKTVDTGGKTWLARMQDHIIDLGTNGATVDGVAASSLIEYGRDNNVTVIVKEFR